MRVLKSGCVRGAARRPRSRGRRRRIHAQERAGGWSGCRPPARRGRGAVRPAGDPRRDADRRHRRAAARAGRHRHRRQPDREHQRRRHARPAAARRTARRATPTARSTRPACTCCPASSTSTAIMAIPTRRPTRPTATGSGSRTASPRCAASSLYSGPDNMSLSDRAAQPRQHDRRAAAVRLSRARRRLGSAAPSPRPSRRAPGCAGRRRRAMTGSSSSTTRRRRSPRRRSRRRGGCGSARSPISARAASPRSMPIAPARWGCRHHPFLRPFRSPAARPPAPRLSERLQHVRRAMAVQPGGPARRPDRRAGRRRNGAPISSGSSSAESPSRPTFNIYSAGARRDAGAQRRLARSATPCRRCSASSQPSRTNHGSYFWDWTTADEVAWRRFYGPYMRLMNDYKNMGGRVTVGSDPGYHLPDLGLLLHPGAGDAAGGGLLAARGDPGGDDQRRARRSTSRRARSRRSAWSAPACSPTWSSCPATRSPI